MGLDWYKPSLSTNWCRISSIHSIVGVGIKHHNYWGYHPQQILEGS